MRPDVFLFLKPDRAARSGPGVKMKINARLERFNSNFNTIFDTIKVMQVKPSGGGQLSTNACQGVTLG